MAKTRSKSAPKKETPPAVIPDNWQRWIAENSMMGANSNAMIEVLVNNGFNRELATSEISKAAYHPYIGAGRQLFEKLKKYEAMHELFSILADQSAHHWQVQCEYKIDPQRFVQEYYAKNRPVLLTGLMDNWKALDLWNPQYLRDKFGEEMVEIQVDRNSDPLYEERSDKHKKQLLLKDYVDMVVNGGDTNDYYMTANNHVMENPGMKRLFDDIEMFPGFLSPTYTNSEIFFWFGPGGTVTPLHHDRRNILIAQVYGRKKILLVPPTQTHLVYNHLTVFSSVDCENPDYEKHPLYKDANVIEGILEPGQVLFLPTGWWHHVRALDVSINVTFTNFAFPNPIFEW